MEAFKAQRQTFVNRADEGKGKGPEWLMERVSAADKAGFSHVCVRCGAGIYKGQVARRDGDACIHVVEWEEAYNAWSQQSGTGGERDGFKGGWIAARGKR